MAKNIKRLNKLYPGEFDFVPRTWVLPQEINELHHAQEQSYLNDKGSEAKKFQGKSRVGFPMIVKPDQMSQGKGIFLTVDLDRIPSQEVAVVQEYLNKPYLINGLKFDMRVYVLVTSCDPLRIYVYQEGLARFATHDYKPIDLTRPKESLKNQFMHLTNYSLNKDNKDYKQPGSVEDDESHKRSITQIYKQLKEQGVDTDKIQREIDQIIIKTMVSVQQDLMHSYRANQPADLENRMCFELLGFDIILDQKLKPWLLEVNQAPSFATDSPLDLAIKRQMFIDMFTLIDCTLVKKQAKLQQLH